MSKAEVLATQQQRAMEALAEAMLLLDGATPTTFDPGLRRSWAQRRGALRREAEMVAEAFKRETKMGDDGMRFEIGAVATLEALEDALLRYFNSGDPTPEDGEAIKAASSRALARRGEDRAEATG